MIIGFNSLKIKIHEIMKELKRRGNYTLPNKNNKYDNRALRMFLTNCNSAYSAVNILFSSEDYFDNLMDSPKATAKFANIMMNNCDIKMPKDNIEEIYNTLFIKYFPIEWIKEHIIENKENKVFIYDEKDDTYKIEKFVDKGYIHITPFSKNMIAIQHAVDHDRIKELYELVIKEDTSI